ncbi:hypothetical protein ACFSQZ_03240 [Rubritalea spongiae]|uniref:Uncharacterized protein n=2 Tax=Rubritalea spongiae TaxID=430797 RepID=A0ABW5E4W6_9BACT
MERSGGQIVRIAEFINAVGIHTFARGQERHELEFTLVETEVTTDAAVAAGMNHPLVLPRHSAPLLIATESGWNWQIASTTVESWPARWSDVMSYRTVTLVGGALTVTATPGDGNQYVRPDGFSTYLRPA